MGLQTGALADDARRATACQPPRGARSGRPFDLEAADPKGGHTAAPRARSARERQQLLCVRVFIVGGTRALGPRVRSDLPSSTALAGGSAWRRQGSGDLVASRERATMPPPRHWLAPCTNNPFAAILELQTIAEEKTSAARAVADEPSRGSATTKGGGRAAKAPAAPRPVVEEKPIPAGRGEDARLARELQAIARMEAAEEKKRQLQAQRAEREAAECKCGYAKRKAKLPKPLAPGGPRCPKCTPLPSPPSPIDLSGAGACAGGLRDAPIFYPTEAEFVDPMAYILSLIHI